jgi:D-alanyl-D-alanine carboxypeptidase
VTITSGVAHPGGDEPMTEDGLFYIASNTKSFTGALILRMAENGEIDLDASVDTYLPAWPSADEVLVRNLLSHTSGYPSWCDDNSQECVDEILGNLDRDYTLDEVLAFTKGAPLLFEPGTHVHYTNVSSYLLGKIAEEVSGRPLVELYRTELLEPLALADTFYAPDEALPRDPVTGVFRLQGEGDLLDTGDFPAIGLLSMLGPAGGMAASVPDLARWGRALWRDFEVLDEETIERSTFVAPGEGMLVYSRDHGFCIFADCPDGTPITGVGSSGEAPGTTSLVVYDRDLDAVLAMAVSRDMVPLEDFSTEVLAALAD